VSRWRRNRRRPPFLRAHGPPLARVIIADQVLRVEGRVDMTEARMLARIDHRRHDADAGPCGKACSRGSPSWTADRGVKPQRTADSVASTVAANAMASATASISASR
jgi:hypothetical protein